MFCLRFFRTAVVCIPYVYVYCCDIRSHLSYQLLVLPSFSASKSRLHWVSQLLSEVVLFVLLSFFFFSSFNSLIFDQILMSELQRINRLLQVCSCQPMFLSERILPNLLFPRSRGPYLVVFQTPKSSPSSLSQPINPLLKVDLSWLENLRLQCLRLW